MAILVSRRFKFRSTAICHTKSCRVPLLDATNLNCSGVLLPQKRSTTLHTNTGVGLLRVEVWQNSLVRGTYSTITSLLEGSLGRGPWKLPAPSTRVQSLQVCELCAKRATAPSWGHLTISTRERALRLIHRSHRAAKVGSLSSSHLNKGFTGGERLVLKLFASSILASSFLLSFFLTNFRVESSRRSSGLLMHHLHLKIFVFFFLRDLNFNSIVRDFSADCGALVIYECRLARVSMSVLSVCSLLLTFSSVSSTLRN